MPDDISELAALPRALKQGLAGALASTEQDLLLTAERLTGGTLTAADLSRMGHPYARRHGSPHLNPAIINAPTGRLQSDWRTAGDADSVSLWNEAPEAAYLQAGTRSMFARPVDDAILAEVGPRFDSRVEAVLDKLFGG